MLQAFSLAVASGADFRCVFVNDLVVEHIDEWVATDPKLPELESQIAETSDRLRVRSEIDRRKRSQPRRRIVGFAQTALQQVRQQVEQCANLPD